MDILFCIFCLLIFCLSLFWVYVFLFIWSFIFSSCKVYERRNFKALRCFSKNRKTSKKGNLYIGKGSHAYLRSSGGLKRLQNAWEWVQQNFFRVKRKLSLAKRLNIHWIRTNFLRNFYYCCLPFSIFVRLVYFTKHHMIFDKTRSNQRSN